MKKILYTISSVLLAVPFMVSAHGDTTDGGMMPGSMMMQRIEDQVLGDELHEEMEDLMIKMMSGKSLTDEEVDQVITFMNENPGSHAMMMNRLSAEGYEYGRGTHTHVRYGHHGMFGIGSSYSWMGWISMILFWGVLILAGVGLLKWIGKSK